MGASVGAVGSAYGTAIMCQAFVAIVPIPVCSSFQGHILVAIVTQQYSISAFFSYNIVFEILLAFSQNKDWKKSFYEVIPQRKVASADPEGDQSETEFDPQQSVANSGDDNVEPVTPQLTTDRAQPDSCQQSESGSTVSPNTLAQTQRGLDDVFHSNTVTCDNHNVCEVSAPSSVM